jgi:hypothetical protein
MLTPAKQRPYETMTYDTNKTTFNFPFEKLSIITGEPTNATITILKRQIYANAMENECTLGCGTFGYLGLIMPDADYRTKQLAGQPAGTAFQPFTKPIPDNTADDDVYKEQQRALRDYNSMESKLKQQLLSAVETTFITALEDAEVGFATVSSKQIMAHLINEYGTVTLEDLYANTEKLNEPWNSEQPIRLLWDRIKECQRISTAGGETITDKMAMFTALKLLDATGLYSSYTTNWRSTYPLQSTWTMNTFREFFNHADKDRKKNLTMKDAGFHGANAAKTYKEAVTTETTEATTTRPKSNFVDPTSGKKIYYCWSHGGTTNPKHTSASCNHPKEGHQKEATWFDMMDGCCEMKFGKNKKTTPTN